ncbi:immunoglobulin-like domain-containing protein [Anaerocolumna sp.]|uniref:immunoglobulin-like domain-containing protein n=1 Tax=Anaerocolumna sp. TaxID=2041569 RepID=UPI0028AD4664|nr:immunoglobulin-like domain-containing protein [Anaerocolumna sp.]
MKKVSILFIIILLPIMVAGCQSSGEKAPTESPDKQALTKKTTKGSSGNSEKEQELTMYLEKSNYSLSVDEITLQIKNSGKKDYEFKQFYTVKKYQDDEWREIPFKKDTGFDDILYTIKSGETHSQIIYLQELDGKITKGKYKIIKDFSSNSSEITLEAEFDIE